MRNIFIGANVVVCKKYISFVPGKNDVEGFGLLATTKKMLNQQLQLYDSLTSIR